MALKVSNKNRKKIIQEKIERVENKELSTEGLKKRLIFIGLVMLVIFFV